ncbi:MAG TPA: Tol-Pal system beta propeller repeat protein TolB [Terriglobales bacterium]|nr:Tol-Pal system beta propeller repeat protein TolB [Terriglobales bacterium]
MKATRALLLFAFLASSAFLSLSAFSQEDWIRTGTGLGVEKVRLAVPDFKPSSTQGNTPELMKAFNDTLWNDLDNAGIFELVSKSFYPLQVPGTPQELKLDAWGNPPPNAGMVAFGSLGVFDKDVLVQGWLADVKNPASPVVLGKQYKEAATVDNARLLAHRFADEIIFRLGGGIPGIAESKIYFISNRSGHKEVWVMDYDGQNQKQVTHLDSITLSPRVSPDGSRLAFTSYKYNNPDILMYSLELGRLVSFPRFKGTNISPAWSSDGGKLAFSSSLPGDPEIYVIDASGANLKRLTAYRGPDVAPCWNPKTNAQIAWVSGRSGLPQIYIMDADGTNVQRITDQGYAVSPSWSPNGQFLTFAWTRSYGPGEPGRQDIYLLDVVTRKWVQLTHEAGNNDFPSWSPDGRHIVFQSSRAGGDQIWMMLADGTHPQPLTRSGSNTQPNWGAK